MRGLPILLAFTLTVEAGLPALAMGSSCDTAMVMPSQTAVNDEVEHTKAQFASILQTLKKYELFHLLDGQLTGQITVRFENYVEGKSKLQITGAPRHPVIIVRKLDTETPEAFEKAAWDVAESYYRIEMRRSFALSMVKPSTKNSEKIDLPKTLATWTSNRLSGLRLYRDTRLEKIAELQIDLYRLIQKLKTLDKVSLFRDRTPGLWISAKSLVLDPGRYISINKDDYDTFDRLGHSGLRQSVGARHKFAVFRAYLIHRAYRILLYSGIAVAATTGVMFKTFGTPSSIPVPPDHMPQIRMLVTKFHSGDATPSEKQDLYDALSALKRGMEKPGVLKSADLPGIDRVADELSRLRHDNPSIEESSPKN